MSWVDRYQREMRRSRWVGITGAMLVLIAVVRELYAALYVISITESLGTDEVAQVLVPPLFVGIAFVARAVALRSAERPYYNSPPAGSFVPASRPLTSGGRWHLLPCATREESVLTFMILLGRTGYGLR